MPSIGIGFVTEVVPLQLTISALTNPFRFEELQPIVIVEPATKLPPLGLVTAIVGVDTGLVIVKVELLKSNTPPPVL